MQNYTYHWEVRDLLTQFLQAFDGAIVKRYDNNGKVGNNVAVRYVYAPKQRVLFDLIDKAQNFTLPAVAFWISNISRDQNRVFNKIYGQFNLNPNTGGVSTSNQNLQPVPVNIEVNVSIMTRFQNDMDQILSNFVPYSDPYFIISWTRREMANIEIRSEVLWNGTLTMGYPVEQQPTQPTHVTCDTSFTIKGWLFKADADPVGRIFKIDTNFYPVSGTPTFENLDYLTDPNLTESFVVSAAPVIPYVDRWLTPVGSLSGAVNLYGSNLSYTNYVYLSGNNNMFGPVSSTQTVNLYALSHGLSASYPALTGLVPALSYYEYNDNKMQVIYPAPSAAGYFDVIVFNDAGYTLLSVSSYNPNLSVQPPYTQGIQVVLPPTPAPTGTPTPTPTLTRTPSPTPTITPTPTVNLSVSFNPGRQNYIEINGVQYTSSTSISGLNVNQSYPISVSLKAGQTFNNWGYSGPVTFASSITNSTTFTITGGGPATISALSGP